MNDCTPDHIAVLKKLAANKTAFEQQRQQILADFLNSITDRQLLQDLKQLQTEIDGQRHQQADITFMIESIKRLNRKQAHLLKAMEAALASFQQEKEKLDTQ